MIEETFNPKEQTDLFENNPYHLVQAGMGKRLLNYVTDVFVFSFLLIIVMVIVSQFNAGLVEKFIAKAEKGFSFPEQMLVQLCYGVYMALTETIFKGKTLGKLITGTRAVDAEGSPVQLKTAALRGLIRIIPFEQFTAFGNPSYPFHDRFSKTYVIDEKRSQYPG